MIIDLFMFATIKEGAFLAETKTLPERKDIPLKRRWRLEDIFATDKDWERAYQSLEEDLPHIQSYQGTLGSSVD